MNATVKPKATILDLDAMMDRKMNDVETIPDFINPPAGLYMLGVDKCAVEKYDAKDESGNRTIKAQRIRVTYKVVQTIDHDQNEQPVADGTLFSQTFNATEQGLEYFKKAASVILDVEDFEEASIGDVIQGVTEAEPFCAKITIQTSKGEGNRVYENLRVNRGQLPKEAE